MSPLILKVMRKKKMRMKMKSNSWNKNNSLSKIKENYGWKVDPSNARALLNDMIEAFGSDLILREISKSMGNIELADNLSYIAENLGYKHPLIWNDEEEEEEDYVPNDYDWENHEEDHEEDEEEAENSLMRLLRQLKNK